MTGELDPSDPASIAVEESTLILDRFDLEVALELANAVRTAAPAPVVVRVASPTQTLVHLAGDGTNRFNAVAVARKVETVFALGHSTLWWSAVFAGRGTTIDAHPYVDSARYTDIPGGVPLRVGGHLVGAAAVSGLAAIDDHRLLVDAIRRVAR